MKTKLLLIVVLLSCAAHICNAQSDTTKRKIFSYSVRAGINASKQFKLEEWNDNELEWRHSFNVGATCDLRTSRKFSLRTGIYYSEKGFNGPSPLSYPYTHLNYLELPLLAVFQQPIGNFVRLEIQVGLFFAYGVSGKRKVWMEDKEIPNGDGTSSYESVYAMIPCFEDNEWENAMYGRKDAGLNFGLGVNVCHFYIGTSYDFSLVSNARWSNHCYMFDLGYTFR
ncbi:MAG: PorT family protein [Bacteroidales bacterium]|nr:PorT family protein [Bacteroidales bacterium]